jgi:sterol desaturase/sphingolipid hydroxylase (fatty acid hydroxylase superfamily)
MADRDQTGMVNTGGWVPEGGVARVPLFAWPPNPLAALKWFFGLPGYLLPWNVFYVGTALVAWLFLMPALPAMQTFTIGWVLQLLAVNAALVFLFTEAWHWRLYGKRAQDIAFKYDESWPKPGAAFLFGDQHWDNRFWTMLSAVPVMTGFMALTLWAMANGWIPAVAWSEHPIYLALVMLGVQWFRDVHFYLIHRLIHWPPLYRHVHFLHHKNANPGPWSGLAMHPVEHALYFSSVLIHWIVPSHPLLVVYHLIAAAFGPARDHCGFATVTLKGKPRIPAASYMHYLHHRYFEVNYGDSMTPIDWWTGTGHDGSRAAHDAMKRRLRKSRMS